MQAKKPIILAILDGFGMNDNSYGNAIYTAPTPNLDRYFSKYPYTLLSASGMSVGLPSGQMGNSEVGHTNIGAGRVVYQELTRISKSIKDGDFYRNPVLLSAMQSSTVHIMGLLSDGGVHSHIEHIKSLIDMAHIQGVRDIRIHCFLDGRDVAPTSGIEFIKELQEEISSCPTASIATVMGRYYSMDRDNRWDRVEKAYNAIVRGKGEKTGDFIKDVENFYIDNITDEFIEPLVDKNYCGMFPEDSVIFANFRPDRAREICRAIADPQFKNFATEHRPAITLTTMTCYDTTMEFANVAYSPESFKNTLGEFLSTKGLKQLRIAETEKYAHVTFFFNGGVERAYTNEDRVLIPSPQVSTYDQQPYMSAQEVTKKLIYALDNKDYDVVILNFANCDMVGHTGNFEAAVQAVATVDRYIGDICSYVLGKNGVVLITADHGNADQMLDDNGNIVTAHSTNPVPFCAVGFDGKLTSGGCLADVAPTIIDMLGLEKPSEMKGSSLIVQ